MSRPPTNKPLDWSAIGVFALLGGLFLFGLAANGLSLVQSLVALGFAAVLLLIAWLWQLVLRRANTASPPTRRERAWDAAVFVAWLAAMVAVAWWFSR